MSCDCHDISTQSPAQQRIVKTALILNGLMFLVGLSAAFYGQSTSVLADAFDMAADAAGYALALLAIHRGNRFRIAAARWTGTMLVVLGLGVIAEAIRRWFVGSEPFGLLMIAYSLVSFSVNLYVLVRLSRVRQGGVHLNASYICTQADVLANIGVFVAGTIVWITGAHWVDLVGGIAIAFLVFSEAREIFEDSNETEQSI